jgi:predicted DNA-binding transcriptional regulator AlpA
MEGPAVTTIAIDPEELISDDITAAMLGVKRQTLAGWRSQGRGPAYVKTGRFVRYLRPDVTQYIAARRRVPSKTST